MKKLLLATTALAMSAGVAAADVSVSGDGRFGVLYDGNDWQFTQRIRARFNMSGTTDTGLTFGGWFRAQSAGGAAAGRAADGGGQNVFIAGAFGRLSMGDVPGAVQTAVGDLHGVGLTGLGFHNENIFFQRNFGGGAAGVDGPNALYTYSMAGFNIAASISQLDTVVNTPVAGALTGTVFGLGVSYEMDGLTAGIGYEIFDTTGSNGDHIAVGVGYDFGIAEVRATYGRINNTTRNAFGFTENEQFGISGSGSFDATTVSAYVRRDFANTTNYGIGASYSLGGGLSLVGGIVYRDFAFGGGDDTRADFGVNMSF